MKGKSLTWDFATSVWAAPLPLYQIRSRLHMADLPRCPGLLNLGLRPRISHLGKYIAINMCACLFWHMAANWMITLFSCALWFWHAWSVTESGVCLQLSCFRVQTIDAFADVSHTSSEGWGRGHVTLWPWSVGRADLWDPVLTCSWFHRLASPDHQKKLGISCWDMICNIHLANSQGVYAKIFTWVPRCLGESYTAREDRKPGRTVALRVLVSILL